MANKLAPYRQLGVRFLDDQQLLALAALAQRTMNLQATLQEGAIWLSDDKNNLEITFTEWQRAEWHNDLCSAQHAAQCSHRGIGIGEEINVEKKGAQRAVDFGHGSVNRLPYIKSGT